MGRLLTPKLTPSAACQPLRPAVPRRWLFADWCCAAIAVDCLTTPRNTCFPGHSGDGFLDVVGIDVRVDYATTVNYRGAPRPIVLLNAAGGVPGAFVERGRAPRPQLGSKMRLMSGMMADFDGDGVSAMLCVCRRGPEHVHHDTLAHRRVTCHPDTRPAVRTAAPVSPGR